MRIGYARVSTVDQNLDLQNDALSATGCGRIFSDTASGAKAQRPGLAEALQHCRRGDTLIVWKLDRLGRSLSHLVETVRDLVAKGIGFKSLQENIDTTTSGGKLIFHLFASLAEFERDIIRERTNAGLSAARARGRKGGRPKGVDEKKKRVALSLKKDPERSIKEICDIVGISRNTYYKYTRSDAVNPAATAKSGKSAQSKEQKNVHADKRRHRDPDDNLSKSKNKVMKVRFDLRVENNNKFVRGKSRAIEEIERYVLSRFAMKKSKDGNRSDYILSIPYTTDKELDEVIYKDIYAEAENIADSRNCTIEGDIVSLDNPEKSW